MFVGAFQKCTLTCVDEAAWGSFAELLGLVGEGDLHDSRDVARWGLHPDGMGRDELWKVPEKMSEERQENVRGTS